MSEITFLHRLIDLVVKETTPTVRRDAPLLDQPYRVKIHHEPDGQKIHISLPCGRYNWVWLPYAFTLFAAVPFLIAAWSYGWGITTDRYGFPNGTYWSPIPLVLAIVLLVAAYIVVMRWCCPRVSIIATRERVTVGRYDFQWQELEGLRLGYSSGGKPRERTQFGWVGMRMQYGAWGYDLPYMLDGYNSAAYVIWANMMLQTIDHVPFAGRVNSIEEGFQKDLF